MDVKTQLVKVHNNDNVAVATCPIVAGTYIAEYDIAARSSDRRLLPRHSRRRDAAGADTRGL